MGKRRWWDDYRSLDLCGGTISFILEDDEDMIEINYADGMLIDVGKPMATNQYCITVVSSNDALGWKNPIQEITVATRKIYSKKCKKQFSNLDNYKSKYGIFPLGGYPT